MADSVAPSRPPGAAVPRQPLRAGAVPGPGADVGQAFQPDSDGPGRQPDSDGPGRQAGKPDRQGPEPLIELVRRAVADRAELPPSSVGDDSRLLGDLHLNSITVSQIVVEIAGRLGAAIPVEPTSFANATVAEVAQTLEELVRAGTANRGGPEPAATAGVATWFRAFVPTLAERPRPPRPASGSPGPWRLVAQPDDPLADRLREAMPRAGRARRDGLPPARSR